MVRGAGFIRNQEGGEGRKEDESCQGRRRLGREAGVCFGLAFAVGTGNKVERWSGKWEMTIRCRQEITQLNWQGFEASLLISLPLL